ncbi:type II toxin-antitoxin system RelE/ParE family toxin [Pleionea mediterranea]|uniref:Toxin ParE1/3/4 n=1 Tax=Pleionea mediterranea TaxID=523701 RepID=A0A316G0I4_9GAMM|nr:type II toxin-antitoxin system RelE/ParE family toxin [Pleionea mediterranea]PWK53300.1 toxin ParE1/3/4 [Pleionea mediterranea]
MQCKISHEAKMDLARIYWHGEKEFGELQATRYFDTLIQRFNDIAESPYKYQAVDHIRDGYRRSVCGVDSIYYQINNGVVEIMRVLGKQDISDNF